MPEGRARRRRKKWRRMARFGTGDRTATASNASGGAVQPCRPPMLLLHGFSEGRHQTANLACRYFRSLTPDLRNYDDSDAPPKHHSCSIFHLQPPRREPGRAEKAFAHYDVSTVMRKILSTTLQDLLIAPSGMEIIDFMKKEDILLAIGDDDIGFQSSFGNLELAVIDGHHFIQQEKAEEVTAEILSHSGNLVKESAWQHY
ncbi:uncharacterized protein [Elaeis guineensis]|uniref:uncharacterized protein n=1 Tax=Elaeis guineensis var. tenera TaxID=51953 RepID=UPI003C6CE258